MAQDVEDNREHIVIVGGGIVGVCTAYFLVQHPQFDPSKCRITLIESHKVAGGASGKAGGLLALWAFPDEIVPLSFHLHEELSKKYDGGKKWGYRRVTAISLDADTSKLENEEQIQNLEEKERTGQNFAANKLGQGELKKSSGILLKAPNKKVPSGMDWLNASVVDSFYSLGGINVTAQVHPYKFTSTILEKAIEESKGALELVYGKVENILRCEESNLAAGVTYINSERHLETLEAEKVVITAGPWTSKILPECPIGGRRSHSITMDPHGGLLSPHAVFTELKVSPTRYFSPEIYSRPDEVYICGEGDSQEVPEGVDQVEVSSEICDDIFKCVSKLSPAIRKGNITCKQACYLPVVEGAAMGPLIGETNVPDLFVSAGHSCWGINNAPATGKVMSEIILEGEAKSANVKSFDPLLYFDANILVYE